MLDDVQLGYYDSNVKTVILRVPKWTEDATLQRDGSVVFGNANKAMKYRAYYLKQKFNHTGGVHVQQRIGGCELLDSDQPGLGTLKDAFNGQIGDKLSFINGQYSSWREWQWPAMWDKLRFDQMKWLHENLYRPICMRYLRTYLHKHKNRIMRKVKPRVRLLQKTLPDSEGAKVTCLATGFYPRHLNLTLLRDGQPVPDHQITGGELLPNADETYQMRKSLEVSAEELQQHHYTCTAEHLSLDNKLDIGLEYEPGEALMPIAASILVLLVVVLVGGTAGFILWKRRLRDDSTSSLSSYRATSSTEEEKTTTGNTS